MYLAMDLRLRIYRKQDVDFYDKYSDYPHAYLDCFINLFHFLVRYLASFLDKAIFVYRKELFQKDSAIDS